MAELRSKALYLGTPGNMLTLAAPSKSGLSSPRSRGRIAHGLFGGGEAQTTMPYSTRRFSYSWPAMAEADWQTLAAFDSWLYGPPPWVLVEPDGVNRLTGPQSVFRSGYAVNGTGTMVPQTAAVMPANVAPGVAALFTPATTSDTVVFGTSSGGTNFPDPNFGAVNIRAEQVSFSFYAKAATSTTTTVQARVGACNADGSGWTAQTGTAVTPTTTTWKQVSVSIAVNKFSASLPFILPVIVQTTGTPVYICNPQLSYSNGVMPWAPGGGVPRVDIATDLSNVLTSQLLHVETVTFSEMFAGAVL